MHRIFWQCIECGVLTLAICVPPCRKCEGKTKKFEDLGGFNKAKDEARRADNNKRNIPRKGTY